MNIKLPEKFYFKKDSGDYAVLLLHGFTGNTSDVRQLGRYLQKKDMTSYSINYEGHAEHPRKITESTPFVWYKEAVEAYDFLRAEGYSNIFVAGVSLGGVFALKLAAERDVTGVATICSPMYMKEASTLYAQFIAYAEKYLKMFEQKSPEEIKTVTDKLEMTAVFDDIRTFINSVRGNLEDVSVPLFTAQAVHDKVIDPDSANVIYDGAGTDEKVIKWYDKGGHVLTIDESKEELFEDIYNFIEQHDLQN
ncbi:Carboxylesterase [Jeotgalicoccus saudimassiliensis]|uniref:Carboxylesterase n=1 Tax=Jeotgalicoccus saudimassiliensis TaxID=1461582 RepID=A0A078M2J5_9STAP|nr:alpha/beta fold hydrolase [Jeotgalicoccus saudimassiliensis]CDZ99096.1 Carboxylesterase [Jeotgalicoccus saudimassiliensis]